MKVPLFEIYQNNLSGKEVFRACNVLPFSCTHLALSTKAR